MPESFTEPGGLGSSRKASIRPRILFKSGDGIPFTSLVTDGLTTRLYLATVLQLLQEGFITDRFLVFPGFDRRQVVKIFVECVTYRIIYEIGQTGFCLQGFNFECPVEIFVKINCCSFHPAKLDV